MAIIGEFEGPVGDVDAMVGRTKIGSALAGRALDTAAFRPHAKAGVTSSGQASAKPSTGQKAKGKGDKEASGKTFSFVIPGLRTREAAKLKEFEDSINQSLIHLQVKLPTKRELSLYQTCYVLYGKLNLKDLAERVTYKLNLEVGCPMKFAVYSTELYEDTKISTISKKYAGEDGVMHLYCDIAQDPVTHGWITVERRKKKVAKNAYALTKQQTSQKVITKTGSVTSMSELVTVSAPFAKFPTCKTKGCNKMSQFLKKREMQLAMDQKSPFVQLKDGLAVRSFGTYGPGGNRQYYY